MSIDNNVIDPVQNEQQSSKEYNFAQLRKQAEQERQARLEAEARLAELEKLAMQRPVHDDDDDDLEPYVDKKKLKKELFKAVETTKKETRYEIEQAVQKALEAERQQNYLKDNSDYYQIMSTENLQKFGDMHPNIAKSLMNMPDNFERSKLVYETMKTLGVHKPAQKEPSIQDKIDANRRSPFFQPQGVSHAPYEAQGDFSESGMKTAYEQVQRWKSQFRGL